MAFKAELASRLSAVLPPHCLLQSPEAQRPFECDALSIYRELPLLTALPETVAQVQAVIRICHELQVPVIPRGAGTGLCAGAMPHPEGLLLVLSKLDRILDIELERLGHAALQPRSLRIQGGNQGVA